MIYLVNLKGFKPFATANRLEALEKLDYLRFHGFRATISKMNVRKYIHLAYTRYC